MRNFFRVKILLDVSKPVVDGFWIEGLDGKKMWIRINYEKLHVFCYKCEKIDHDFKTCSMERVMREDQLEKPKYESWLGTSFLRGRRDGEIESSSDLLKDGEQFEKAIEKNLEISDLDQEKQALNCRTHDSDGGGGMNPFTLKDAFNDIASSGVMNDLMCEYFNYHLDVNMEKSQLLMTAFSNCDCKMFVKMCENEISGSDRVIAIDP